MRFVKIVCVMALVLAVSAIAYAETQSVKISGDLAMRAFARGNFDLSNNDNAGDATGAPTPAGAISNDWANYLLSTAEVQVDADLTDNVSGVIRLVNQRVWGDNLYNNDTAATTGELIAGTNYATGVGVGYNPRTVNGDNQTNTAVEVDLAYIELKEFLYSPLTLKIGRQDLWFGKGFIVGANLQDPRGSIYPMEYTAIRSFDAVRATLDYDPWTIDAVFAKIQENSRRADDDSNLWGVNIGYIFDMYNAEAEAYWWFNQDRHPGTGSTANKANTINGHDSDDIHVIGARTSLDPIEDWTIALESAYQFGNFIGIDSQVEERDRSAWALDASLECRYWQDDFAWKPVVGLEYIFYSGEKNIGDLDANETGDFNGWDGFFRGKFDTAIREFQNVFYRTAQASSPSASNQHQLLVTGSVEPTDSLSLQAVYGHFWLAQDYQESNTKQSIGDEVDLKATWAYTEDVSFDLLAGWFFPGDHFQNGQDDIATDVVGSVSLSF